MKDLSLILRPFPVQGKAYTEYHYADRFQGGWAFCIAVGKSDWESILRESIGDVVICVESVLIQDVPS